MYRFAHPGEFVSREIPLRANFLYSLAGNAIFAASQWGILTVLVKFGDSETVGRFVFASALVTPFYSFSNLQLRQIQASDASGRFAFADYLGTRFLSTGASLVLIVGLILIGGIDGREIIILMFGLTKAVESISDIHYGLFQRKMRLDLVGSSLAVRGVTSVLTMGLAYYLTRSLFWALIAILVSWLASLFIYDIKNSVAVCNPEGSRNKKLQVFTKGASSPYLSIIRLGLPLGLVMIMIALETSIPRFILDLERGESELGIFAALIYPAVLGNLIITAVSEASLPQLGKDFFDKDMDHFRQIVKKSLLIGFCLAVLGLLAALIMGDWLLRVLYTREYSRHAGTFSWIMGAAGLNYLVCFLGAGVTAMQKFKVQSVIHGANLILLALLSFKLIGAFGLRGGAYAMLASSSFLVISYGIVVWNGCRTSYASNH